MTTTKERYSAAIAKARFSRSSPPRQWRAWRARWYPPAEAYAHPFSLS